MNNFLTRLLGSKTKTVDSQGIRTDLLGWHDANKVNTILHTYADNQYENGYASIQAITNQFIMVNPYAISATGNPVKNANVINVLARPNQSMSGLKFREALSVMSLVHNKVYIRVWHTGNKANEKNITGLTFMEGVVEIDDGNNIIYRTPQGEELLDDEVIILKNINPYDLDKGYSVANAARRWANLDDYIAAYQTGFFENGAVPAGQFIISAPSIQEYQDIVANLKRSHRGASKNNNVVYDYAPTDPMSGKPMASAITWVPFNTTNKDLSLEELFTQVNKKIDSAYGVPASMRGVSEGSTYTNVRVDQEFFIDNCVRPFATKLWTQFTHELNRLTGGLGYLITFDLETPHIAEEDKAFAEAQATSTATLLSVLALGYTLESAVEALQLDESFLVLDKPEMEVAEEPEDNIEEVDEGDEVEDTPEQEEESKKLDPLSINCKQCGRYLFKATGTTVVEDMPCPKCKATNNFKIINPMGDDITHEFTFVEKEPKDWKQVAHSKQLSPEDTALVTDKIEQVIRNQMERQIDRVDIKTKKLDPITEGDAELYAKEIMSIVAPLMTSEGMKQYILARLIDDIDSKDLTSFVLTEKQMKEYETYLIDVAKGYAADTEKAIKAVLQDGIGNKLPAQDVKKNLDAVMNTDEYRVKRLALTETNRAGNAGSIFAMEQIAKDADIKVEKVWQAKGDACQFCKALDGTAVGVADVFVPKGETITGTDGGTQVNDFGHMDVPTAHSNCSCYVTYKVVK